MSLNRFVYYNAVVGGWAAFLVWLTAEVLFLGSGSLPGTAEAAREAAREAAISGVLLGLGVGTGLNVVAGLSVGRWRPRLSVALLLAVLSAAAGGLLGAFLYLVGFPRAVGWTVLGLGIGAAEGIYQKSAARIRNGLIGGAIGGFVGGLLFDPIASLGSDMSSRAAAFVILGTSIGALIGLTQVVLREAWLTVVDGFLPGRQLILSQTVTVLGRGDHLPLPFLGYSGKDLDSEHLRITRQPDGRYVIEDNLSRLGTMVNGQRLQGAAVLNDGDLIRLGPNIVRFERRQPAWGRGTAQRSTATPATPGKISQPPPPPAPPIHRPTPAPEAQPGGPPPGSSPAPQPPSGPRIPPPPPPPS
ncbi:MAG: FHA domain-containing protein [Planctomycetota bacterium]|jgi:hypothetical protein